MVRRAFPEYLGVVAFGVKMGVILAGDDISRTVYDAVKKCHDDNLIDDNDIICVKENVVARAQNNFVTLDKISEEVQQKLHVSGKGHLGVLFPIISRNRFAPILKGIARAVKGGKVTVQLSYPTDEVGNQTIPENALPDLCKTTDDKITQSDLGERCFMHPITGVDYIKLYNDTITAEGATPDIFLCNNSREIIKHKPAGIIVSNIHEREKTKKEIIGLFSNCITLQEICNDKSDSAWSEWGLYGSNLMAEERLKLAPRESSKIAKNIQQMIREGTGRNIEVVIYGDGAYKDPSTGIFELADPGTFFGLTKGLENVMRTGVKYKWLVDNLHTHGVPREKIEEQIQAHKDMIHKKDSMYMEGTTPRIMADVASSLADLVSGSADAGTPVVVVKGLFSKHYSINR